MSYYCFNREKLSKKAIDNSHNKVGKRKLPSIIEII